MTRPALEAACEVLHDAYEAAAVEAGWETQQASRKPWAEVPEANKETMRASVSALLDWLVPRVVVGSSDGCPYCRRGTIHRRGPACEVN